MDHLGIKVEGGGWMRPEDFCNTGPKGSGLHYTSSICFEEVFEAELGIRVVNEMVAVECDGGNLLVQMYGEWARGQVPG